MPQPDADQVNELRACLESEMEVIFLPGCRNCSAWDAYMAVGALRNWQGGYDVTRRPASIAFPSTTGVRACLHKGAQGAAPTQSPLPPSTLHELSHHAPPHSTHRGGPGGGGVHQRCQRHLCRTLRRSLL